MKAFNAMAEVITKIPVETQNEILAALEEDFNNLTALIEESDLNHKSALGRVSVAVENANKRNDPNGKHFTRWNMEDSAFSGAYQRQRDMQYAIRNMIVECRDTIKESNV